MKVKFFVDNYIDSIQESINLFLEENQNIEITHIEQSESNTSLVVGDNFKTDWGVTVSIWYAVK